MPGLEGAAPRLGIVGRDLLDGRDTLELFLDIVDFAEERLEEARAKVRQIVNGSITVVENWRQLADGRIEFTMRRLPTAD